MKSNTNFEITQQVFTSIPVNQLIELFKNAMINEVMPALKSMRRDEPADADEFLTVEDTAKFLHLSVASVYGLTHRGELPVMKRSKRCYFSKKELIEYLKQGRRKTVAELDAEIQNETDAYLLTKKKKG
jgi:hypothetical protein